MYGYGILNNHVPTLRATVMGANGGGGISFDTDALAFITSASITDMTQKSAVNTLVKDLKSANIWTKMKAIYPMVGGSASSHKFNLKDPRDLDVAYRLVFNGGWTHSSNGILPNGTTAYANTYIAPSAMAQDSIHASYYSRTDVNGLYIDLAAYGPASGVEIMTNYNSGADVRAYVYINTSTSDNYPNANPSTGLFIATRTVSNIQKLFRNSTILVSGTKPSLAPSNYNFYLGAENFAGASSYSPREQAFASIGDGMTDAEASALYNAVQTYQTTLGRQV